MQQPLSGAVALIALFCALTPLRAEEPGALTIRFKDAKALAAGQTFVLKKAAVRRFEFSQKRPANAYSRIEIWFTNADIDICNAPDLRSLRDLPLDSENQFVLVWQTVGPGFLNDPTPEQKAKADAFYAAFFTDRWPDDEGRPKQFALTAIGRPASPGSELVIHDGASMRIAPVSGALKSLWVLRHLSAKKGAHEEWHFDGGAIVTAEKSGLTFLVDTTSKALDVKGTVHIDQICEAIRTDAKYWQDR